MGQSNKSPRKTTSMKRGSGKTVGKKFNQRTPRKTIDWSQYKVDSDEDEDDEDEQDEDEDDENDDNEDNFRGLDSDDEDKESEDYNLDGLYSLIGNKSHKSIGSDSDNDDISNSNIDGSEKSNDLSSSDSESDDVMYSSSSESDEDVENVKLQIARARKGLKSKPKTDMDVAIASDSESESESESTGDNSKAELDSDSEIADVSTELELKPKPKPQPKTRRKSSIKYGRRRSDAVLPELKFEFDQFDNSNMDQDNEQEEDQTPQHQADISTTNFGKEEEEDLGEDLGEEVDVDVDFASNIPLDTFDFDHQLMDVPRIGEEELNSDADYEFNEDELIATLADNDDDILLDTHTNENTPKEFSRNNSIASSNNIESFDDDDEDDDNDPFLKEEEKFLVREFETNGFDEEGDDNNDDDEEDDEVEDVFNLFGTNFDVNKPIVKYESNPSHSSDDDDDNELINLDFNINSLKKKNSRNHHHHHHHNEDFDDNTYLFNYFFSSDNESSGDEMDIHMANADELFQQAIGDPKIGKKKNDKKKKLDTNLQDVQDDKDNKQSPEDGGASEDSNYDLHKTLFDNDGVFDDYESGESTEEEVDLPFQQTNKKIQSFTKPSEVISHGVDPRPPIIGTWSTSNYKPFKVIDGSSVLSLVSPNQNSTNHHHFHDNNTSPHNQNSSLLNSPNQNPNHPRKSILVQSPSHLLTEDLAIGLDELLNVELIDDGNIDENDIKIWREFNNETNNKKKIPLGAFRNKSILYNHNSGLLVLLNNDGKFSNNNSIKKPKLIIRRKSHHHQQHQNKHGRNERTSISKGLM